MTDEPPVDIAGNKRWFMSYVKVYSNGSSYFGHSVYESPEHPVVKAERWNKMHGAKDQSTVVVLSFREVVSDVPETDTATATLSTNL